MLPADSPLSLDSLLSAPMTSLRVERADAVAEVVLAGPGKGNAMGPDFWRELPRVFRALDADEAIRAIIVRGAGGHFSYGLDLLGMAGDLGPLITGAQLARDRTRLLGIIEQMQGAFNAVAGTRQPVI